VNQSCPKTRMGIVQNITLMRGFDPLQMLTTVVIHFQLNAINFMCMKDVLFKE